MNKSYFVRRFVASILDSIITISVGVIIFITLQVIDLYTALVFPKVYSWFQEPGFAFIFMITFIFTGFNFWYYGTFEPQGASLGKRFLKLQVLTQDGIMITKKQAYWRYFCFCVPGLISMAVVALIPDWFTGASYVTNGYLIVGALMSLFSPQGFSLWDRLSNTKVVEVLES